MENNESTSPRFSTGEFDCPYYKPTDDMKITRIEWMDYCNDHSECQNELQIVQVFNTDMRIAQNGFNCTYKDHETQASKFQDWVTELLQKGYTWSE
jgi:hypothetical protein